MHGAVSQGDAYILAQELVERLVGGNRDRRTGSHAERLALDSCSRGHYQVIDDRRAHSLEGRVVVYEKRILAELGAREQPTRIGLRHIVSADLDNLGNEPVVSGEAQGHHRAIGLLDLAGRRARQPVGQGPKLTLVRRRQRRQRLDENVEAGIRRTGQDHLVKVDQCRVCQESFRDDGRSAAFTNHHERLIIVGNIR